MAFKVFNIFIFFQDRGFPMMHLAMVSKNGTIWDISLNENRSPSKHYLLKLPKSCTYHGYSDAKGVLYFIDGHLRNKLTKYHSSFDKKGHKKGDKIDVSKICSMDATCTLFELSCYKQSLQFGNIFWLYGHTLIHDDPEYCK